LLYVRYDGRRATRYVNDPSDASTLPGGRIGVLH
jgi:hypothetical protein